MNILDIAIAKKLAGGGGGSGTDNYNDLSNLPKINDTTLSGNKSSSALGLQSEINSDSKLASDLVDDTNQDNKFVTSTEKNTWNGKQNAIDADHKLSSDLVDDANKTNKFVTSTEKNTWNAKQNAIDADHKLSSDLVDDANKTNKFVTSTEKNTWNAKQNAIDSDHKLSSSLVSFTTAEAAALASGINSSKVGQISTNQTNILYACERVGKNLFDITSPDSTRDTTVTPLDNGGATLSCSSAMWTQYYKTIPTEIGKEYKVVLYIDSVSGIGSNEFIVSFKRTNPEGSNYAEYENITTTGTHEATFTATVNILCVAIFLNNSATAKTSSANVRIMVCEKNIYDIIGSDYERFALPNTDLTRGLAELNAHPFLTIPVNHNMVYRGQNLGDTLTADQDAALSSGNFTDLYLGDYWTKSVTIPAGTYTGGDGEEVTVPAQTNITLKAVIADFDTFYCGYDSTYAGINTHHAAVIVTGFSNVTWNKTNSTAGGYVASLIHKWLVGSALPQLETWFGSAKVLLHKKMLTNAITGDAASGWAWSSQKISLLSENQIYGSKVWGNSGYELGETFKHLNVFNHIDANLIFGNKSLWLRDIASASTASDLCNAGFARNSIASHTSIAPAALILLS